MNFIVKRIDRQLILIVVGVLLIMACNAVGGSVESINPTPTTVPPEATATAAPTVIPQGIVETEPPEPPEPGGVCPDGPATYGLQASHNFWTPTGMGDWTWQASGFLQVALDAQGRVTNTGPQTITGSQSGAFSDGENSCSFEAPAEVIITIDGGCAQGVINLEIWEDWQMGTYKWACDEDSFQFDLPSQMMPPSIHKVEYQLGNPASYSFEIPFGGGNGSKTYTLVP
jgi:hypothetical protein